MPFPDVLQIYYIIIYICIQMRIFAKTIIKEAPQSAGGRPFAFLWCHRESNQGHKDFQSFALPTEL